MAANTVDQDQQWLLNCLSATLDPNQEVRSFAEASLQQASLQPGFGAALSRVAANRELSLGLRQISFFLYLTCQYLAAVLLKQFIRKHWQEGEDGFEHPAVSSEEKEVIRRLLLSSLDDSHRRICTAISMAITTVAVYDWPEDWPDLLPFLMKLINDQSNVNGVHGALRCLSLLSGDLDDTVVPSLIPVLFPCLHTIISSQTFDKYVVTKALTIVYSCTSVLGTMSGVYKTETSNLLTPMLKPWMDQFSIILGKPVQLEDPDDWSVRMEVLKCLNQFVQNFPNLPESDFMVIVGPLWQTFVTSLSVYVRSSVQGIEDSYEGRYDSDGAEKSLESFVIQLFEFLLTMVGSAKLTKVVCNNVKELAYYTIAFLQMTEQQVNFTIKLLQLSLSYMAALFRYVKLFIIGLWMLTNLLLMKMMLLAALGFLSYSARILLLEEVVTACGIEGINAIIDAAKERFIESQREKDAGSGFWWRMMEAALFTLACLADQLLEAEASGMTAVSLGNLVEQMVNVDIKGISLGCMIFPSFMPAFLYLLRSTLLCTVQINHGVLEHFLYAAIKALDLDVPPPVKVGACRALSQLMPEFKRGVIQPQIVGLASSLTNLLHQASDETLHLVLETLQTVIVSGHESAASIEPIVSPVILNMWVMHVSDPFISIDAIEVLEAIKNAPGGIHPLVSRILPHIGPILNKPHQQPDGLTAGSLDLVTMLLKAICDSIVQNAPSDVVKAVYDVCFDAVIRIILQSDDHSEMQNATQCLAALVSGGKQNILAWSADSGFTMRSLLDAASRLLDPDLESSGSLFVGSYVLQLILHLPAQMAPHLRDLVAALVRRMQSAQIAGLKSSLLLIFARLVHMSAPNVEQFIDMLIGIPASGYENSFSYIMSEWTKQQGKYSREIQGAYQIKVTTSALALLLSAKHANLDKVNVQGHLIKSAPGITTRSKAKLAPDQWTVVPLPVKILCLLADVLIEIQEQVADDEESDWEEIQEGGAGSDKNLLYSASATSAGRTTYDELEAMAKTFTENLEVGDDDDLLSIADPLNERVGGRLIWQIILRISSCNSTIATDSCLNISTRWGLTAAQQDAVKNILER
ncbi:hypothetical protein Tsubulata_014396 [Turnera subulata]|uniref:Importin N-terminal domain-containing protein n=1 Tax=Turnera subulata TaxID=218843 RepID=A0A9Q0GDI1_9ROSI|nr:hypothetical protein Tsubulata_014396 [Turnera subulata]